MISHKNPTFARNGSHWLSRALLFAWVFVFAGAATSFGAAEGEHHTLPLYASEVFSIGPFIVTNSMLVTWIVGLGLIVFAQIATRNMREVPTGLQNFWEWLVESLSDFLGSIIGRELALKTFWFFATLFLFITFANWFGLLPGVGSIGFGTPNEQGALGHLSRPLWRGANADLNMTFAIASVFFLSWIIWSLQANGPVGFFLHIFGPKGGTTGFVKVVMIFVFLMVGVIEVVSIIFRPVSLSFRLFGNVYAGESMLETMALSHPYLGWLIAIPFYFFELLVGVVQALVFMLLTAVFTFLMCDHSEESH